MTFRCRKGTRKMFRFKKIKKGRLRLGGCGKKGKFIKIKEFKKFKK